MTLTKHSNLLQNNSHFIWFPLMGVDWQFLLGLFMRLVAGAEVCPPIWHQGWEGSNIGGCSSRASSGICLRSLCHLSLGCLRHDSTMASWQPDFLHDTLKCRFYYCASVVTWPDQKTVVIEKIVCYTHRSQEEGIFMPWGVTGEAPALVGGWGKHVECRQELSLYFFDEGQVRHST